MPPRRSEAAKSVRWAAPSEPSTAPPVSLYSWDRLRSPRSPRNGLPFLAGSGVIPPETPLPYQDVPRFADLGVVASMQPIHLSLDMAIIDRILPLSEGKSAYGLMERGEIFGKIVLTVGDPAVAQRPRSTLTVGAARLRPVEYGLALDWSAGLRRAMFFCGSAAA